VCDASQHVVNQRAAVYRHLMKHYQLISDN
jgi:hypothetical protein